MPSRTALVTGATGQDGALLCSHLISLGYRVTGTYRRGGGSMWRLQELGIDKSLELVELDLADPIGFERIFRDKKFSEVYHLAANSFVMDSFMQPALTLEVNAVAAAQLLEAIRWHSPQSRVFLASSSETFSGHSSARVVDEDTPDCPANPYGISKAATGQLGSVYRKTHDLYVVNGILFNHESEYRPRHYVSRKISINIAKLKYGLAHQPLLLGSLDSARDFSSAKEVVVAMHLSLQPDTPTNYVVGSGKLTTVRDLLVFAVDAIGLKYEFDLRDGTECMVDASSSRVVARVDPSLVRKGDNRRLVGDSSRLREATGWRPTTKPEEFVNEMVLTDLARLDRKAADVQ